MALVAIVGRPNVGKSTLFNRLTESRSAIVHDQPGVTRDRIYGDVIWNGRHFSLIDTGGFVPGSADRYESAIREQVAIAIEEADVILFVVDVMAGISAIDDEMAAALRKSGKKVIVIANKADTAERRLGMSEFYQWGLGDIFPVSATNGSGTGEMLDALVDMLPESEEKRESDAIRIAILGRPNVGKSSLTNALLGVERSIVTEISGTTRDSIDVPLRFHKRDVVLVDTAGLRKRSRITENVEFYSTLRTERAVTSCDVAILLVDATRGLESQDIKVLKLAEELGKGLVIGVNKWDLMEKETNTARDFARGIQERLKMLSYVPIVFISAETGQRIHKALATAIEVADRRTKKIPTPELNAFLEAALDRKAPPLYRHRAVRIKYASQVSTSPPMIAMYCNYPKGILPSYQRYLVNQLRQAFDLEGVPVKLSFRKK